MLLHLQCPKHKQYIVTSLTECPKQKQYSVTSQEQYSVTSQAVP